MIMASRNTGVEGGKTRPRLPLVVRSPKVKSSP